MSVEGAKGVQGGRIWASHQVVVAASALAAR